MPYNANPRMPKTCDGCIYQSDLGGSYKVCIYIIETGQKRPCPPENCTVYQSEKSVFSNRLPDDVISEMRRLRKAGMQIKDIADKLGYSEQSVSKYVKCVDVKIDRSRISREQRDDIIRRKKEGQSIQQIAAETGISHTTVGKLTKGIQATKKEGDFTMRKGEKPTQEIIDKLVDMRKKGMSLKQIEKATGISHTTIIRYTSENPAAAATTTGQESANQEKLSETIVSPNQENVKPLEEPTETPSESEDKPDVETYEHIPETSADERTEGAAARDVPFSVIIACITRISDLTTQLHDCEKMSEGIRREIAELEAFIR